MLGSPLFAKIIGNLSASALKHIRLGVQENRVSKYYDEDFYTTLAVLDFNLPDATVSSLLGEALELVAQRTRYSMRELVGTMIALRDVELRAKENLLARESSMYCSAFVQYLFRKAGVDLTPGVHRSNTTPEDISRTAVPHITYLLQRDPPPRKLAELRRKMREGLRERMLKRKAGRRASS